MTAAAQKTFSGKASGKFILLGEHFVVPHGPADAVAAIAFPLPQLHCEVKIAPSVHPQYRADLPKGAERDTVEALMARATYAAANSLRLDVTAQPLKVESRANFPISRGFGSSAAFAVALVRALDEHRRVISGEAANWDDVVKATGAIEKVFHGRPSGVDAAVILAGRPIRFANGGVEREIENRAADFVVVDSGDRDQCAALIRDVAAYREKNMAHWQSLAKATQSLVDQAESALVSGDTAAVGAVVKQSHGILSELGLSNPAIDDIIDEGLRLGAYGGKVSGAGGGGAVLLVAAPGRGEGLAAALRAKSHDVIGSVEADTGLGRSK